MRLAFMAWVSLLYYPLAAAQTDSVGVTLNEITVEAASALRPARIEADGSIALDAVVSGKRMRTFGEADAMRHIASLPGVAQGSDYSSGVSVDGGEFSHTFFSIGGAPVFFPYHFGGIFSVFNAEHLPSVHMEKSIHTPDMPGYIGGRIDFSPRTRLATRPSGMVNIGLIAAGISFATRAGKSADISASARISFLNLLYGKALRDNTTDLGYGFHDFNLTARLLAGKNDRLTLNAFYNRDYLSTDDSRFTLGTRFGWHNVVTSLQWQHADDRVSWTQSLYFSSFGSTFRMSMTQIDASAKASISQFGTRGNGSLSLGRSEKSSLLFGAEAMFTGVLPQNVAMSGLGEPQHGGARHINSWKGCIHAGWRQQLLPRLSITAGAKFTLYGSGNYHKTFINPMATISWQSKAGTFNLHAGTYTQTLHQVGFSDIGLASNFWIDSNSEVSPQRARTIAASWFLRPGNGDYELSADVYYKHIRGASEYDGSLISMLGNQYNCFDHILSGTGRNYGFGLMASRIYGKVTGSVAFAYGRAQRRFPEISPEWVTAAVEQRLRTTLQCHYQPRRDIGVDAAWTYATGRPTTPVESLYVIGQNIITVYGSRNSRALPAYHRLDLSASWQFKFRSCPGIDNMLILSVINAYGHRNVSMVTFDYDRKNKTFSRHYVASLYRFIPSIAYVLRF